MIKFELSDWRTNASILGLVRILKHSNLSFKLNQTSVEISEDILENFEYAYFNYFSDRYEKDLPWYRIVSYEKKLNKFLGSIDRFKQEDLAYLNGKIDLVKDYLNRANYKKVYPLIKNSEKLVETSKSLKKITLKKNKNIEDIKDEILVQLKKLSLIIEILMQEDAKKHIRAKGVIYSHINRGIGGRSFLNQQTKFIDVFEDYRSYFIEPLIVNITNKKKAKNSYECFSCGMDISSLKDSYSINLINQSGFDDARKTSYVWNHISDVIICPKCNFLYSMISAGFNYSLKEGIFINYSRNIEGLIYSNDAAKSKIEESTLNSEKAISYRTIVAAIERQNIDDLEYEEKDIQIIRQKDERYNFNILSKQTINVIKKVKDDLKSLEKASFAEMKLHHNIYDEVMDRIFNGQNMFNLIHFMLVSLISNNSNVTAYYNSYHIVKILNINYEILFGGMYMDKINLNKQIYFSRISGNDLRKKYIQKGMENKIAGISYRLLNALKTKNSETFMHNVLNAYMYLNEPVPQSFTIALEDEEKLGMIGYAFVTGINGTDQKTEDVNKEEKERA